MEDREKIFCDMYSPLKDNLQRFCRKLCRNSFDAEDLMQDTLEISLKSYEKIIDKQSFLSYLFTIATRVNRQNLIKKRKSNIDYMEYNDTFPDNNRLQDDNIITKDLLGTLILLPYETFLLFTGIYIMGFTREELCKRFSIKIETLNKKLYRGKKQLANTLKKEKSYFLEDYIKIYDKIQTKEEEYKERIKMTIILELQRIFLNMEYQKF
jgi:RNA polymerase sigma factor (sigma-70 family)